MSSSTNPVITSTEWAPKLDLTPKGLSQFDPARIKRAIEDGYEAGHHAGRAEALATSQEAVQAALGRFHADAEALLAGLARATDQLARTEAATAQTFASRIVDAAIQIAEAVVGRELSDETVAATAAVERALGSLDRRTPARLQLHPDDLDRLDGMTIPDNVIVEANPNLHPGEAIAETDDRTVDARIGAAIERARAALAGQA